MPTKKRTALIIGHEGQDGTLLFSYLTKLNYRIIGIGRKTFSSVGIKWDKKINIEIASQVFSLMKKIQPDEVYYLAAYHHSAQDKSLDLFNELKKSHAINVQALGNFLEGARLFSPHSKIFYASSSLIFENCGTKIQNEKTKPEPASIYGLSKTLGMATCRLYRDRYGLFASSGILYNHESEHRPDNFLSKKIINAALAIKNGQQKILKLGSLTAKVDWGYAPDYVRAMSIILRLKKPEDFIIATGNMHTVEDFARIAFKEVGLNWRQFIQTDKKIIQSKRPSLRGNASKLKKASKWRPSVSFEEMIKKIIKNSQ